MQLIIEIGKDMLDNPNRFPTYMFQAIVLDGIPLQEYIEEIKADIIKTRDMIPNDGDFCLGVKTGNTNDLVILDKYIEELNNENP